MGKYAKIKNLKDLLAEIKLHGRATDIDSVIEIQDIIGHSTEENLVEAIKKDGSLFYHTLFAVWNYEDATRYYNNHSNTELIELRKESQQWKAETDALYTQLEKSVSECEKLREQNKELRQVENKLKEKSQKTDEQSREIMELKAKLYDIMIKECK